jgi:hypothetical protein
MWDLTQRWYGDRLDDSYAPKPVEVLEQMLADAGLTSVFWRLRA